MHPHFRGCAEITRSGRAVLARVSRRAARRALLSAVAAPRRPLSEAAKALDADSALAAQPDLVDAILARIRVGSRRSVARARRRSDLDVLVPARRRARRRRRPERRPGRRADLAPGIALTLRAPPRLELALMERQLCVEEPRRRYLRDDSELAHENVPTGVGWRAGHRAPRRRWRHAASRARRVLQISERSPPRAAAGRGRCDQLLRTRRPMNEAEASRRVEEGARCRRSCTTCDVARRLIHGPLRASVPIRTGSSVPSGRRLAQTKDDAEHPQNLTSRASVCITAAQDTTHANLGRDPGCES